MGWCIAATRETYRKLLSTGDYAGALKAVQMIAKFSETINKSGHNTKQVSIDIANI